MSDATADSTGDTGPGLAEALAERASGVAAAALGVDVRAIIDAWGAIVDEAVAQPKTVVKAAGAFVGALKDIWLSGRDAPVNVADSRFSDPAWSDNPLFKRIGQSYQAWTDTLDDWLLDSGLQGMSRERARFVLSAAKDVMAPVNTLVGNPEALRRLVDSRGSSLVRGVKNFIDDVRHNHGYPAVADRHAFELGVDVAASAGSVVFRNDLFELIQYSPKTATVGAVPLLYVFSQVNRFYLGDLTPDRSLFQRLLDAGIQVFAVSWKNPTTAERDWNLDTYVGGVIEAVKVVREVSAQPKVHLIGVCAGGLAAATAAGVMAARKNDWVDALSLFINVLDFRPADSDFGLFVDERSVQSQKAAIRNKGIYAEKDVFEMFALLRIEENIMSFFRSNYLLGEAPLKHPLLFWSMDYTRVPAEMQCDLLDLSQTNQLAKKERRVLGKRVDLSRITYPVYLMAGSTDHITPWKACYRSTQLFGGPVTFILTNQNHTQTISGRLDNKHLRYWIANHLPANPEEALEHAAEHAGSWTFHWIDWLQSRAGAAIPAAATLGSERHPVIAPAPGSYVRES
ncbi:MAG: PHA/PHB synthase family protein [Pseudomonadales bacterium]|jgi:polyhydroxyalkanoate synthase